MLYILTIAFVIVAMYVVFALMRTAARAVIFVAAAAAFWYVHRQIAAGDVATAWDAVKAAVIAGAAAGVVCTPLLPLVDARSRGEKKLPAPEPPSEADEVPAAADPEHAP